MSAVPGTVLCVLSDMTGPANGVEVSMRETIRDKNQGGKKYVIYDIGCARKAQALSLQGLVRTGMPEYPMKRLPKIDCRNGGVCIRVSEWQAQLHHGAQAVLGRCAVLIPTALTAVSCCESNRTRPLWWNARVDPMWIAVSWKGSSVYSFPVSENCTSSGKPLGSAAGLSFSRSGVEVESLLRIKACRSWCLSSVC